MRYYRRRYRRRTHRGTLILLLVLSAVFLVSCVAGANPLWVRSVFGLDVTHFDTEPSVASHPTDGALAAELCDMVEILTAGSIYLDTFRTPSQALTSYRDAILNDMLRDNYLRYTGNTQTLSLEAQGYPQAQISTLIPAEDFEAAVERCFGLASVRHQSGEVFEYRKDMRGYTAPLQAWLPSVDLTVQSIEETEHTYRMVFTLSDGVHLPQDYTVTFARHESGGLYFYSLEQ